MLLRACHAKLDRRKQSGKSGLRIVFDKDKLSVRLSLPKIIVRVMLLNNPGSVFSTSETCTAPMYRFHLSIRSSPLNWPSKFSPSINVSQLNKLQNNFKLKSKQCCIQSNNYFKCNSISSTSSTSIVNCTNIELCSYYQYVCGLHTKFNVIKCSILSFFYNFIIITETWLILEF